MRRNTGSYCATVWLRPVVALALVVAGSTWSAPVHAQAKPADEAVDASGYRVLPPVARFLTDRVAEGKVKAHVKGVIDGKNLLTDNQTMFDAYFNRHYFPMMTQTDPKALEELPQERYRFIRDYLENAKDAEVHEHVVDLAISNLVPIVQGNFHPAVRYNALIIIGSLNQTEAVRIGNARSTPEPHIRALPILYTEFTRKENSDLLKVAALVGLVRHMEWDPFRATPIPPATRNGVIKALQDLALQQEPPEGRSLEGHNWMRRRAIEGLGHSGWVKGDPGVLDALNKVLTDETEPVDVRVAAASAIGRSSYVAPAKMDTTTTAKELGQLAVVSCLSELDRVANLKKEEEERQKLLKNQSSGGYGGSGYSESMMPGYGAMGDGGLLGGAAQQDPKGYRLDPLRRKMRARLYGVQLGLVGPADPNNTTRGAEKLAKTPAEKKAVADIRASLEKAITIIETPDQMLADLDKDLRRALKPLDDLTRRPKPVAPAADSPEDELGVPGIPPAPTAGAPAPGPGKAAAPAVRPTSAPAAAAAAGR